MWDSWGGSKCIWETEDDFLEQNEAEKGLLAFGMFSHILR